MPALDSKFSQFADGGDLIATDIVVGLRGGVNTRFAYTADAGIYLPLAGGVMTGAIDMGSNLITNVSTPISVGDAANKAYADLMLPLAGGTMSGAIAMGASLITGVLDPVSNQDAATKVYVDTAIGVASPLTTKGDLYTYDTGVARLPVGANDYLIMADSSQATGLKYTQTLPSGVTIADYLPLAGGTMSGAIAMGANLITGVTDPASAQDAATKAYSDLKLPLVGGTLSGILSMGSNTVDGLPVPANPDEAATKGYVDGITSGGLTAANAATTSNFSSTYDNGASGVGATLTAPGVGVVTFDDIATVLNGRYTFKDQTAPAENGVYKCTTEGTAGVAAIFTRSTDFDEAGDMDAGDEIRILAGTTLLGSKWMMNQSATIVVGTTAITWINVTNSGLGTMANQNANAVAITGGTIDGTVVGGSTTAAGSFTDIYSDSNHVVSGIADDNTVIVGGVTYNACFAAQTDSSGNSFCYLASRHTNTAGLPAASVWSRSRGTYAAPLVVANSDTLALWAVTGYDGTDNAFAGTISWHVNGVPGANDMPGEMRINITPNGSGTPAEKVSVDENGMQLGAANARVTTVLDEDDMSSDSATALATQQSIKAYVDAAAPAVGFEASMFLMGG